METLKELFGIAKFAGGCLIASAVFSSIVKEYPTSSDIATTAVVIAIAFVAGMAWKETKQDPSRY